MKHLFSGFVLATMASLCAAQTVKPALPPAKPKVSHSEDYIGAVLGHFTAAKYVTSIEKLTADGHYVFTLDDPNDEYRCYITANNETATTIVCVKAHMVPAVRN